MSEKTRGQPLKTKWAYGYKIVPPQTEDRLSAIKVLLDSEHADAKKSARTWASRVVHEEMVTHIMVVSDSPAQNRTVNSKLEAALKAMKVGFTLTKPLALADDAASLTDTRPRMAL